MRHYISRRDPPAPSWTGVPAPTFTQGISGSYSLSPLVTEPGGLPLTFTSIGAALPSGVSIVGNSLQYGGGGGATSATGCRLRATSANGSADSAPFTCTVQAAGAVTDLTSFQITSSVTSASQAWAFGHAFRAGDVPAGNFVTADAANFQFTPLNYWRDGSVKFGVMAGRQSVTANVPATITIRRTPNTPTGGAIQESTLATLAPSVSVALGAFGTVTLLPLIGVASTGAKGSNGRVRTFISGPQMSEWHYRTDVGADSHLAVWFYVRLWANNALEIEVMVENGYVAVASPVDKSYAPVITINGTSRYAPGTITHWANARWRTIHWYDGSSGLTDFARVTPTHNATYFKETGVVPYYGGAGVSSTRRAAWSQSIAPLSLANTPGGNLGGGGSNPYIGLVPEWTADYVNTSNASAYRAMYANGGAWDVWPLNVRDHLTGRPVAYSQHASRTCPPTASPTNEYLQLASSTANPSSLSLGTLEHLPGVGYVEYLATGRFSFLESCANWDSFGFLVSSQSGRNGAQGLLRAGNMPERAIAWGLRQRAMATSAWPDSMAAAADNLVRTDRIASIQFVLASFETTSANNQLGHLGEFYSVNAYGSQPGYSATDNAAAMWMMHYLTATVGLVWDLDLPLSAAARASHLVVRDRFYKSVVGMMGDADGFNYRYNSNYGTNLGTSTGIGGAVVSWFTTWKQVFDSEVAKGRATNTTANFGDAIIFNPSLNNYPDIASAGTLGYMMPALAYAVKHGADGAVLANLRFVSASNYSTIYAQSSSLIECAQWWVVAPDAPGWFTAIPDGQWGAVAATGTINAALPSPVPTNPTNAIGAPANITNAWVGGWVDPDRREYGLAANGGHADYPGNEVYAISLFTRTPAWRRMSDPTPTAFISDGSASEGDGTYADGRPRAMHNTFQCYGNRRVWMPLMNSVTSGAGGSIDRVVSWNRDSAALQAADDRRALGGSGASLAHTTSNLGPWAFGDYRASSISSAVFGRSVYNPRDGYVYAFGGQSANTCEHWRVGTGAKGTTAGAVSAKLSATVSGGGAFGIGDFGGWVVYMPDAGTVGLFVLGDQRSQVICIFDPALFGSASAWRVVPSGNVSGTGYYGGTPGAFGPVKGTGGVYLQRHRQIAVGDPRDIGARIYKLQVPSGTTAAALQGATWTWSSFVPAGPAPTTVGTGEASGAYSKWQLIEDMGNKQSAIVFIGRTDAPVSVYRVPLTGLP